MLSGLLEKHQCAECRFCCIFDKHDFWEMPSLLESTAKEIFKINPNTILNRVGDVYTFDSKNIAEELYPCPALTDMGCGLSNEYKPFECSIWPFRVMNLNGELVLAICIDCLSLKDIPNNVVDSFANKNIRKIALKYAEKYPEMVKPYHDNYRIIQDF